MLTIFQAVREESSMSLSSAADQSDLREELTPEQWTAYAPPLVEATVAIKSAASIREKLKLRAPTTRKDMPQPEFLVGLHAVTCGQQGLESGVDEAPICQLAFLVYDVLRKKVVAARQLLVKPLLPPGRTTSELSEGREDGRAVVTVECRVETGITDESLDSASGLAECLADLDRTLQQAGAHPDFGGRTLRLVTDGQATLRLLLHPEAAARRLVLPDYCYRFHDLRKEFAQKYGNQLGSNASAVGMLCFLGLKIEDTIQQRVQTGIKTGTCIGNCLAMSRVIGCLLADGHQFLEPETITKSYSPAVVRQTDSVDHETVVRTRGLPWQAGDAEIACFFSGLNVQPGGVALVLSRTGRRNGEALVRFESPEQRDLALLRHRHHIGQRYIEVFKCPGQDFLAVAAVQSVEAEAFLVRLVEPRQQLVRMRGLPYSVTAEQVLEFFDKSSCPVQYGSRGLLFAHRSDGRATGDAFVLFSSAEAAEQALIRGHRQHIGSRYVELFKSTPAELNQVLGGYQRRRLQSGTPVHVASPGTVSSSSGRAHLIRIQGMPAETTVADIIAFLEQHSMSIVFQGVHQVLSHLGLPTGEAVIEMTCERAVQLACEAKDGRPFCLVGGLGPSARVDVRRCSLPGEMPRSPLTSQQQQLHPSPAPMPTHLQVTPASAALMAQLGHGGATHLLGAHHLLPPPTMLPLQSPFIPLSPSAQYFPTCPQPTIATFRIPQFTDGLLATQTVMAI